MRIFPVSSRFFSAIALSYQSFFFRAPLSERLEQATGMFECGRTVQLCILVDSKKLERRLFSLAERTFAPNSK